MLLYQSGKRLPGIVFQPARPHCVEKCSGSIFGTERRVGPEELAAMLLLTLSGFVTGTIYSWETGGPRLHDVAIVGNDITRGTAVGGQSLVLSAPAERRRRPQPDRADLLRREQEEEERGRRLELRRRCARPERPNHEQPDPGDHARLRRLADVRLGAMPVDNLWRLPLRLRARAKEVDNLLFAGNKLYNCRTQALFIEEVKGPTNNVTIVNNFLGVTPGTCSMCAGATYPGAIGGEWLIAFNTFNRSIGFTKTGFTPGTTIRIVGNVGLLANKDPFGDNSSCTSDTQGVFSLRLQRVGPCRRPGRPVLVDRHGARHGSRRRGNRRADPGLPPGELHPAHRGLRSAGRAGDAERRRRWQAASGPLASRRRSRPVRLRPHCRRTVDRRREARGDGDDHLRQLRETAPAPEDVCPEVAAHPPELPASRGHAW